MLLPISDIPHPQLNFERLSVTCPTRIGQGAHSPNEGGNTPSGSGKVSFGARFFFVPFDTLGVGGLATTGGLAAGSWRFGGGGASTLGAAGCSFANETTSFTDSSLVMVRVSGA